VNTKMKMSPEEDGSSLRFIESLRSKIKRQHAIRNYLGYRDAVAARENALQRKDAAGSNDTKDDEKFEAI